MNHGIINAPNTTQPTMWYLHKREIEIKIIVGLLQGREFVRQKNITSLLVCVHQRHMCSILWVHQNRLQQLIHGSYPCSASKHAYTLPHVWFVGKLLKGTLDKQLLPWLQLKEKCAHLIFRLLLDDNFKMPLGVVRSDGGEGIQYVFSICVRQLDNDTRCDRHREGRLGALKSKVKPPSVM
ncbi:hypothetical protein TRSC58_06168 [Trypanosoma rangeli SC58]|uniref:Uncharacterized protein n=1 Tax=Trypanosoma rangeli SC58 TaxID=429131 RepID=A0A061IYR4_TRYRA|nr:hypothetical protein TRSC58_06168 [Trypanosoma rangeli SC58]